MNTHAFVSFTLEERISYSPIALKALAQYEKSLKLSEVDTSKILGRSQKTDIREWRRAIAANELAILPNSALNRLRLALIVFRAISEKFIETPEKSAEWMRKPHSSPMMRGKSPIVLMSEQSHEGIQAVVRCIESKNFVMQPQRQSAQKRKKLAVV